MKSRRKFMGTALAGTCLAFACSPSFHATTTEKSCSFPGIIYTRENPGKWAGKIGSHTPMVTVKGGMVKIETRHPMSRLHFIVRHTIVDTDGNVLGEKTFYPEDEKAISEFDLSGKKGRFFATSFCNKHDFWLSEFMV